MVCKESVNLEGESKKRDALARSRSQARSHLGGGPRAKRDSMYHKCGEIMQESFLFSVFRTRTPGHRGERFCQQVRQKDCLYFAATELTSMVSPSRVPVTVAVLPACLSREARAALSLVSRV